ncbi:MAG: aldolase [Planctomycetes bacterium]|nr:aldolase [Planctomycetota bacterium]
MVTLLSEKDVKVPADVSSEKVATYVRNFLDLTWRTGRLHLFAGDQKVEHLNDDFYGEGIHEDDADPVHLFNIASKSKVSCLAVQYGYASLYARDYPGVPLLIKMNSKSHLVGVNQRDPVSRAFVDIEQVAYLRDTCGLNIRGIGYTTYPGSEFEAEMLSEAGRLVSEAHELGLVTVLWMYPRGKAVPDEKHPHLIAGVAGVALTLGTDFVKVNMPKAKEGDSFVAFKEATRAAGRTRVITAGGSSTDVRKFLDTLHKQIHVSGCVGAATGRNIHQKSLSEAVRFNDAMASIIFGDKDVDFAMKVNSGEASWKEDWRPEN